LKRASAGRSSPSATAAPRPSARSLGASPAASSSVSVVIVAYNTGPPLARCLESLEREDADLEVVLVNNGGRTREVVEAAQKDFVRLVEPGTNLGFAGGANLGAEHARGEVFVFLNPDTVAAPGAIAELARTLEERSIGIAMPRLRLLAEPELLNSAGNVVHVSGLAWPGGYRTPAEALTDVRDVPYATGAALAVRADVYHELGGFTDELFMYQEDLELSWRARLRGLRVVVTPRADIYHDYRFEPDHRKRYLLERNRLVFVLSSFSPRLLALLAPVLASAELAILAVAVREGWAREKVAGWAWLARNARWLAGHRRETQLLRRVSDRELADVLTPVVDPAMASLPRLANAGNRLVSRYWSLARRAL
jgi:GT2 family glycosyltransferase